MHQFSALLTKPLVIHWSEPAHPRVQEADSLPEVEEEAVAEVLVRSNLNRVKEKVLKPGN